jgi:hypothetical protein
MAGLLDFAQMAQMLQGGLLGNVAYDPITNRNRGMNPLASTEGARTYGGGSGTIRAYHGTDKQFDRFELPNRRMERGVFMTPDKSVAARYSGRPGQGRTIPLDVSLTNAARVDYGKAFGSTKFDPTNLTRAMELARKKGKDFLVVENISDLGGPQTQIIGLRPAGKVKNAATGATMFSGLLGALLSGEFDRKEPLPPM